MADDIKIRMVVEAGNVKQVLRDTGEAIKGVGDKAASSTSDVGAAKAAWQAFTQGLASGARDAVVELRDTAKAAEDTGRAVEQSAGGFSAFGAALVSINAGIEIAQKAFQLLSGGFNQLGEILDRGNRINDLEQAFKTLGATTGATSEDLKNFENAMGGVITHADALATVNKAVSAGLDPKIMDDAAKAARAYADSVGIDAKQALDSMIESLVRGNDRALKNMGIIVDNKKAYEDFAAANGIAADTLNELGKAEAIRAAAAEALKEKVKQLGETTNDSGDNFVKFKNSITNAMDEVFKGVSQNEALSQAMEQLANAIKSTDFAPLIAGISSFITSAAQLAQSVLPSLISGMTQLADAGRFAAEALKLGTLDPNIVGEAQYLEEGIAKVNEQNAALQNLKTTYNDIAAISLDNLGQNNLDTKSIDGMIAKLATAKKAVESLGVAVPKTVYLDELNADLERLKGTATSTGAAVKQSASGFVDQEAAAKKAAEAVKAHAAAADKSAAAAKKQQAEIDRVNKSYTDQANKIVSTLTASKQYADIQKKLADGTIDQAEATKQITALYDDMKSAQDAVTEAQENLNEALLASRDGSAEATASLGQYVQALDDAQAAQSELAAAATTSGKAASSASGSWTDYASQISGMFGGGKIGYDKAAGAGGGYGYSYADIPAAIGDIQKMWGTDYTKEFGAKGNEQKAHDIAQRAGVAISSYFAFGIPAAIYAVLGKEKFTKLEHALDPVGQAILDKVYSGLFGQNEDTFARRQVRNWINDNIKGKGIKPIDLGPSDAFNQPGWADEFNKTPNAGAFNSFSAALTNTLGVAGDISGQIAKVLSDNVGGSLNDLQLLIQATGLTAEQMKDAIVNSFLDSKLSATEALSEISAVTDVFTQGIPGALGATVEAMQNLIDSGLRGRKAVDALGDLGAEALEKHETSLAQLQNELAASGKYSAEDIKKLFDAIAAAGITSLEQLKGVSNEAAISILAGLEGSGFAFEQVQQNVQDIKNQLEGIKDKEATVTINVKTKRDEGTTEVMNSNIAGVVYGNNAPGNA